MHLFDFSAKDWSFVKITSICRKLDIYIFKLSSMSNFKHDYQYSWWHSLYWHVCAGHKELVKNSLSLGRICNKIKSLHGLCVKFSISILPSVPTQTFCYTMHHMPKNYCSQHMIWKCVHLISSQSFSDSYLNVLVNMGTSGFFVFTCFLFKVYCVCWG